MSLGFAFRNYSTPVSVKSSYCSPQSKAPAKTGTPSAMCKVLPLKKL